MSRTPLIEETELTSRLAGAFSDVGYEGASLALLSRRAGLGKASLYHRFPGGKRQMAERVLAAAWTRVQADVIAPLTNHGLPAARLAEASRNLDAVYLGGGRACLLNMLASPRSEDGPFAPAIKAALEALIDGFAQLALDAGRPPAEARRRAERAVTMLQGSLVLARGLGSPAPFQTFLSELPQELLT